MHCDENRWIHVITKIDPTDIGDPSFSLSLKFLLWKELFQ